MPVILTTPQEMNGIRSILGVTDDDLTDIDIQSTGFLEAAESIIIKAIQAQSGYDDTVPTIEKIMADPPTSPATLADQTFLKSAVIYRAAFLFGPGETSAVDTSVSIGPITKDLGGVGQSWKDQMQEFLALSDQAIGSITGFKRWRTL